MYILILHFFMHQYSFFFITENFTVFVSQKLCWSLLFVLFVLFLILIAGSSSLICLTSVKDITVKNILSKNISVLFNDAIVLWYFVEITDPCFSNPIHCTKDTSPNKLVTHTVITQYMEVPRHMGCNILCLQRNVYSACNRVWCNGGVLATGL